MPPPVLVAADLWDRCCSCMATFPRSQVTSRRTSSPSAASGSAADSSEEAAFEIAALPHGDDFGAVVLDGVQRAEQFLGVVVVGDHPAGALGSTVMAGRISGRITLDHPGVPLGVGSSRISPEQPAAMRTAEAFGSAVMAATGDLQTPQRHGTLLQPRQTMARDRQPLRQEGHQLSRGDLPGQRHPLAQDMIRETQPIFPASPVEAKLGLSSETVVCCTSPEPPLVPK